MNWMFSFLSADMSLKAAEEAAAEASAAASEVAAPLTKKAESPESLTTEAETVASSWEKVQQ